MVFVASGKNGLNMDFKVKKKKKQIEGCIKKYQEVRKIQPTSYVIAGM